MLRKLALSLLLCAGFLTACTPGDEAPPENPLVFLGQDLVDLLHVSQIDGNYFEGVSKFEDCTFVPIESAGCVGLEWAQGQVDAQVEYNTVLIIDLQNNGVSGRLLLAVPHFNAAPNSYTVGVAGSSTLATDTNLTTLTLSQTSVTANVAQADLNMSLTSFRAEQLNGSLLGTMTVRLTQTGRAEDSTITYAFTLDKKL